MNEDILLHVKNLETAFDTEAGRITVLDKIGFTVKRGETLGIVGESGCGKSVTSLSIMRLLPRPSGNIVGGEILFKGQDLASLAPDQMQHIRGNQISMIFQEPMTALNPVQKIGNQMSEVYELHHPEMSRKKIFEHVLAMLKAVGIPDPERRLHEYPHQLSGGIRQTVMIAMAISCKPDLLIADEPTTALDVTIQAQILKLLKDMQSEMKMSIMFITHDLGVIAQTCDRVVVMYAGRIAEEGPVGAIFKNPKHPYTKGLLDSIPRLENKSKEKLTVIEGMVPDIYHPPPGCRFENRCRYRIDRCSVEIPKLEQAGFNHHSACFCIEKL